MENRSCYGQAFRQLRLDRGYSLKEAAGNIISPQMLGVFEHGKSGISLNNFGRLLIRIGATWNDFFRYYNGESILKELSLSDEILVKINNGHYYDGFKLVESSFEGDYSDNPILETVYKLSYQSYFQTLSLTSKLTDDELENILKSPSYNHLYTEKFNFKFYQAMNFLRQNNPKGLEIARDCIHFLEAFEALDNSNASAIDKNKILSAVSVLNKTGIPFKES